MSAKSDTDRAGVYIWPRCFLRQVPSFELDRRASPYRRLSATVLVANDEAFSVRGRADNEVKLMGAIVGPAAPRSFMHAPGATTTVDAFITSEAYPALLQAIGNPVGRLLNADELSAIQALCQPRFGQLADVAEAQVLFDDIITVLNPKPEAVNYDPSVAQAMALVEAHGFDELSVAALADSVHVSVSRLNALFKQYLLCSPLEYIRSVCLWKSIPELALGATLTDAAHAAGFYDLAHFSKAVTAITGFSPSLLMEGTVAMSFT